MGNYKFRSIKLEVRVSGYMDILISNTYSARPLSLNRKEGTTGDEPGIVVGPNTLPFFAFLVFPL